MTHRGPFQPLTFCYSVILTGYKEDIFYDEDSETLEWAAQRSGRCFIPGNIQGQVGWGSEQLGLEESASAHGRGLEVDNL